MTTEDRYFHWSNAVAEMTPQDQADWIASVAGDDDAAVAARMKNTQHRAVAVLVMCPNCESRQELKQGFPTRNCTVCGGTGYLDKSDG